MQLHLIDGHDAEAQRTWTELEKAAPRSFFLSWGWMENWLACLPPEHSPELAVLREGDQPIAACFLNRRDVARLGVVGSRALYLNTTGTPRFDSIWIEYNGLAGSELGISRLMEALPDDWDELFLPGLRPAAFGGLTECIIRGFVIRIDRTVPSFTVDLQYQSGVAESANKHLKPGFLAHAAAIEHSANAGLTVYDFLAGERRYKKSLSTDQYSMIWARVQRQRFRFLLEDGMRNVARTVRARRAQWVAARMKTGGQELLTVSE